MNLYFALPDKPVQFTGTVNSFLLIPLLLLLQSCGSTSKLKNENISSQFSHANEYLSLELVPFQFSDDSMEIKFSIHDKGLLFMNAGDHYLARLNVRYTMYSSYTSAQPIDSGSANFEVHAASENAPFENAFSFKFTAGSPVILKVVFKDLNRNLEVHRLIPLNKAMTVSPQRFLFTDSMGRPLYRSFTTGNEMVRIIPGSIQFDTIWVRCYLKDYPLAVLPFRVIDDPVFDMKPDSVFSFCRKDLNAVSFRRNGIYFFQTDTVSLQGFALNCYDPGFPKVTRAEQLIESTRYITTRKEYLQLMGANDKKAALDKFWLEIGGHPDRARNLIRTYYNRVQEANRLFSSYLEGWKTDRGMIHMIFGMPQSVYRDGETEQWTYSNIVGFPDMLFLFRKMNNPFTDNDYALIRQPVYENVWYIAVDQWRQGRIVNEN